MKCVPKMTSSKRGFQDDKSQAVGSEPKSKCYILFPPIAPSKYIVYLGTSIIIIIIPAAIRIISCAV